MNVSRISYFVSRGSWCLLSLLPTASCFLFPCSVVAREQTSVEETAPVKITTSLEKNGEDVSPMRVSMEFQDASLKDILKIFSQQSGINLIASEDIGDRTLTLYFEDVTVMDALDQLLEVANLTYERPPGSQIYLVKPKPAKDEVRAGMVTKVYRLRFAHVSASKLSQAAGSGGGTTTTAGATGGGTVGIDEIIKDLLSENGTVVVDGRTNSLIVTDLADNFPRIEASLAALDVRTPQIMIETELLEITLKKSRDLGIKWSNTTGDVVTFTPGSARSTRFPFGFLGREAANTGQVAPQTFGLSTLDFTTFKGILQALEQDTHTRILARPKILTMDNESAVIELTTNQAIGFTSTSQSQTGSTSVTPEREKTGVNLIVTPQVNDGGWVSMVIEPKVTKVEKAQVTPPSSLGTVVDPKSRSAKAVVRVLQGHTLVLGGLIDRTDETLVQKVPVLGDIPLLGKVFTKTEVDDTANELIVFITPHILEEPDAQVALGALALPQPAAPRPSRRDAIEAALDRLN